MNIKESQQERHVLALIVDNEAGVLGRVVGLFSGRGYNINSLTVSEIDKDAAISRITITTSAPPHVISHIVTLLERLIPVHKVRDLTIESPFAERALLLVKVTAKGKKRQEILHLADTFDAREVDATDSSFVFELTDIPGKLNEFVDQLKPYGVIEIVRTGIAAISRGNEGF